MPPNHHKHWSNRNSLKISCQKEQRSIYRGTNKRSRCTPTQLPPCTRPELLFDESSCLPPSDTNCWEGELTQIRTVSRISYLLFQPTLTEGFITAQMSRLSGKDAEGSISMGFRPLTITGIA